MRIFTFFIALSLQAATPRLRPPDPARQQQTVETVRQFALTHLNGQENLSCRQAWAGTAKTITLDLSDMPGQQPGATTGIDTASLIQNVFALSSGTQFEWDHWGSIGGKKLAVYRYSYQMNGQTHAGSVFADEDTGAISRMTFRGVDTPAHLFCSAQK